MIRSRIYLQIVQISLFLPLVLLIYPKQFFLDMKISLIYWAVLLAGLILVPLAFLKIKEGFRKQEVYLFIVYLIVLSLSAYFSFNPQKSFLVVLLNLASFVVFLTASQVLNSFRTKQFFIHFFVGMTLLLSVISLHNTLFRRYVDVSFEGLSFLWVYQGHNHLASLLLISLPLCLQQIYVSWKQGITRYLLIALSLFFTVTMFLTFSRAALLSLIMSFSMGILFFRKQLFMKFEFKKLLPVAIATMAIIFLFIVVILKGDSGIKGRYYHLEKGIRAFTHDPVTGLGPGTFGEIEETQKVVKRSYFAHNIIIHQAAEVGLVGVLIYVVIIGIILLRGIKAVNHAKAAADKLLCAGLLIGILSLLINDLFDFDLQIISVSFIFWVFASFLVFRSESNSLSKSQSKLV